MTTDETAPSWDDIFETIQRFMDDTTFEEVMARLDAIDLAE